jgi:ABC-type Fe3+-hydroxamate transport system substrate-binding protein
VVGPRLVSLVPSVTETLLAWGVEPVACTRFCEQPILARVGGTKDPDLAAIVSLQPDLVVMDAEENRREDHDALVASGVAVHALHVRDLADLDPQLGELAARVGARWTPLGAGRAEPGPAARRAFVPIWKRPWMALGEPTYGSSLLAALGVANAFAGAGPYPETTLEEAAAQRPDLVVAPSEPYPFAERHRAELASVAPTVFVDGRDLLWWGARTAGALARLTAALTG